MDTLRRALPGLLIAGLVVLVAATFRDYGITNDEPVQHTYGKLLLDFYASGLRDLSAFSYKNLYLYGGLFDLVTALLLPVSPFGEYETRHLLAGMIGVLGIAGTFMLGRQAGGARVGLIAALLLAASGAWYGAMFNNTKDIPFATGIVWTLWALGRLLPELPRPRLGAVLVLGLAAGLTVGVRVGVVLVGVYGAVVLAVWAMAHARRHGVAHAARGLGATVLRLLPAVPVFYALMAVLWPWAVMEPLNPLRALSTFNHFAFLIHTPAFGTLYATTELPFWYLPGYLAVKLPLVFLAGLALAAAWARPPADWSRPQALRWLLVGLAALFPVAYFMLTVPPIYNGIRHFMFVLPPLAVIAAFGLDGAIRRWKLAPWGLGAALAWQAVVLVRLHPNQYVFYNSLVGGVAGAQRGFELDYWSNSMREATMALGEYVRAEGIPAQPYKVEICSELDSFATYAPPWLEKAPNGEVADFYLSVTQQDCDRVLPGEVILTVERMGAVLAVAKDRRKLLGRLPSNQ